MLFIDDTTQEKAFHFDFQFDEMFDWTEAILEALMPVVYITLGISLAFVIVRALKSAFA